MSSMTKKQYIIASAKIIGGLFVLGFGVDSYKMAPDNTKVFITSETKDYYPATENYVKFLEMQGYEYQVTTQREALDSGRWAEKDARERGYFMQKGRSLSGKLLEAIGIFPPLALQWNSDGSWNIK